MGNIQNKKPRVLLVILDGFGISKTSYGNAVALASLPHFDAIKKQSLYCEIAAHGRAVGMPSDDDMGNSEVGHNAMGAGQIFDQGAKLVENQINSGAMFSHSGWQTLIKKTKETSGSLHFIGLLSDGNVHSNQGHLEKMISRAKNEGIKHVYVHTLFDGRDVSEKSAEIFLNRLFDLFEKVNDQNFNAKLASGGGRMHITMDRYGADWQMVKRGWDVHVHGKADFKIEDPSQVLKVLRQNCDKSDQYLPSFVIVDKNQVLLGKIQDGDAVVCFNFRGDRVLELSLAFTQDEFSKFDRGEVPKLAAYAGMMLYDGDAMIPPLFLVSPPEIKNTLGAYLVSKGIKQFACSETQKFGHVTYFWNGNRSRKFSEKLEEYVEIKSDLGPFDERPEMKARGITDATLGLLADESFQFGRINFANGDMVGHTGNLNAAIEGLEVLDIELGRLADFCKNNSISLIVTADHGNCEEMFEGKEADFPKWQDPNSSPRPRPKTSHTLNPVPCLILPANKAEKNWELATQLGNNKAGLANLAATILTLLDLEVPDCYEPSLLRQTS